MGEMFDDALTMLARISGEVFAGDEVFGGDDAFGGEMFAFDPEGAELDLMLAGVGAPEDAGVGALEDGAPEEDADLTEDEAEVKIPGRCRVKAQAACNALIISAMVREGSFVLDLRLVNFEKCISVRLGAGVLSFVYERVHYMSLNDANCALNKEFRSLKGLTKKVTANAWKLKVCPSLLLDLGAYCGRQVVPYAARGEKAAAAAAAKRRAEENRAAKRAKRAKRGEAVVAAVEFV